MQEYNGSFTASSNNERHCDVAPPSPPTSSSSPSLVCQPASKTSIPPAFVVDSKGRKLFRSACRARGVAAKGHTPQTAFLLIPENAPHGYILRCSHPWCNKTGRLFRYCVVCRQAVTKRNFHQRHCHGLVRYNKGGQPLLPSNEAPTLEEQQYQIPTDDDSKPSSSSHPDEGMNHISARLANLGNGSVTSDTSCPSRAKEAGSEGTTHGARAPSPLEALSLEEQTWVKLYRERPKEGPSDDAAMAAWFAKLLEASYPSEIEPLAVPSSILMFPANTNTTDNNSSECAIQELDGFNVDDLEGLDRALDHLDDF